MSEQRQKIFAMTEAARLLLRFARVDRATRHDDGSRPETDTDHTVMLAVLATEWAPEGLDRGMIAQYALVHDLLEAITGDVPTLKIDAEGRARKAASEAEALDAFKAQFGAESWIVRTIENYEAQTDLESQYVHVMDKLMPKLTHILNSCAAMSAKGISRKELANLMRAQVARLTDQHTDARLASTLADFALASDLVLEHFPEADREDP